MYYFIKYGYDGAKFTGFQRGNGVNSIEDGPCFVICPFIILSPDEYSPGINPVYEANFSLLRNLFIVPISDNIPACRCIQEGRNEGDIHSIRGNREYQIIGKVSPFTWRGVDFKEE